MSDLPTPSGYVVTLIAVGIALMLAPFAETADWKPAAGRLMTRWAKDVSPEKVHTEYPRPQMVREKWVNLNGLWDYAITDAKLTSFADASERGKILVPFPVESALSGVMKRVPDNGLLLYRRTFVTPEMPKEGRLLLHFGACDWATVVSVNGQKVGEHRGGYDPFTFDITDALKPRGEQELAVAVSDPTDSSFQPRGKQVRNPQGIWYTPTTGIWQTVWLEPVPKKRIERIKIVPDLDAAQFHVTVEGVGFEPTDNLRVVIKGPKVPHYANLLALDGRKTFTISLGEAPRPWSPDDPYLHDVEIALFAGEARDQVIDKVASYCAMRKISLGKDEQGVTRIMLNNKPLFQFGPLDQGFWPDGLYTAPTDEALRYDIEITKQLGFNMIRKHVKVEPDRWYYWCDKLGMLVWQDMPSGDKPAAWDPLGRHDNTETTRSPESAGNYNREWKAIIDALRNHPCIVMWVPFNEGWGQANTVAVTKWTREYDPTRLVNCASGGNDFLVGDVIDVHRYPGPFAPIPTSDRAAVLGEFGGLGLPLRGHTWQDEKNWGYRSYPNQQALTEAYVSLIHRMRPLIGKPGLSAAVYTQTTDVEIEVNGLLTYDRELIKPDAEALTAINRKVYLPPPELSVVVATSQDAPQTWRYTTTKPGDDWFKPGAALSGFREAPGGFGRKDTPGSVVRTEWTTPDIWAVRTFTLDKVPVAGELYLKLHHDEDAEIYLNGVLAAKVTGYTTEYVTEPVSEAARNALKAGENTLAVHCHQTGGGQYIDVGLVNINEVDALP